jgi:hypothetical protein
MTDLDDSTKLQKLEDYNKCLNSQKDIQNYLNNSKEDEKIYLVVTIDCSIYNTNEINNILNYDTIISENTNFIIKENTKFIIKRSLKNYGTIINNGLLIIYSENNIGGCFENYGNIISNGFIEVNGVLNNLDKGSIISKDIINNGIINNCGLIENNKLLLNECMFNNSYKLIINGELINSYFFHNKKVINSNETSEIVNNGIITNSHIIHNETLILNLNQNSFINSNILINTGTITNCKYSDNLIY